jgi:hypothetical protein
MCFLYDFRIKYSRVCAVGGDKEDEEEEEEEEGGREEACSAGLAERLILLRIFLLEECDK